MISFFLIFDFLDNDINFPGAACFTQFDLMSQGQGKL